MDELIQTPSQTVGPFFAIGLPWNDGPEVFPPGSPGGFWVRGRLLDGAGEPVPDGIIETWQADPEGRFDAGGDPRTGITPPATPFRGYARAPTDPDGAWAIHTSKPGIVPGPGGHPQAPHIVVTVVSRGLLDRVVTRIYFADEDEANATDPILGAVPEERRHTIIAQREGGDYRLDIRLQGEDETVFFDV
jgi:protocatechuate 3,4-dioxygenase alpha subunit